MPYLIGFGALSALAWHKAGDFHGEAKVLSPNLQYALNRILDGKLSPEKYLKAAALFEKYGLKAEGQLLRKRAKIASLPEAEKMKLTNAYGAAMRSQKPEGIRAVANTLEAIGAVGAAANLRDHADKVQAVNSIAPVPLDNPIEPIEQHEAAMVADEALQEEENLIAEADLAMVPPLDVPHPGDLASGPPMSPGASPIPEAPPALAITDDISVEPMMLSDEKMKLRDQSDTDREKAEQLTAIQAPIDEA